MSQRARLSLKNDPQTSYTIDTGELVIGRSEECDVRLTDGYISRLQARVYFDNGKYVIENIGSNPISINGNKAQKRILCENDVITLGKTDFLFQLEAAESEAPEVGALEPPREERTVFMATPAPQEQGPRLIVAGPSGAGDVHSIKGTRVLIGRSPEADLRLDDLSVSRRHCIIEKEKEGFVVKSLTYTNPVIVDGQAVNEKPLVSGDQLSMGPYTVTFLSDRPEDVRHWDEKVVLRRKWASIVARGTLAVAILSLVAYLGYVQVYAPRKVKEDLKSAAQQIDSGELASAHDALSKLLETPLPANEARTAMELFSRTILLQGEKMAEAGKVKEARNFLAGNLGKLGTGKESKLIRDKIDAWRLRLGQELEASGENLGAMRELSGITEESPYFDQAQQAISRIWLSSQQKSLTPQPAPQLLEQAEEHFAAKRYTTPFNRNAYALYKMVLSMDPSNTVAKERISQMKGFYIEHGDRYYQQKNCAAALSYFERYMLIDPEDPRVKEKVSTCRRALGKDTQAQRPRSAGAPEDRQQENVRRLLEGTGGASP